MTSRVGSALDHLAAALVALAVFALPISIIALAKGASGTANPWFIFGFILGCLLTGAALTRLVAARGGLPRLGETFAFLAGIGILTWVTAALGLYTVLSIVWSSSRCTGNTAGWAGTIGALVVYTVAGGWSLGRRGSIAFFVMPGAVVAAAIWTALTWRYLPAGPGVCND